MTREQAIYRIQEHMRVHKIGQYPHVLIKEALDMAIDALQEQEELENPKPLTLAELRGMDGPVWVSCKPIEGGYGYWCLCKNKKIITPAGSVYAVEEIPHWVFYHNKPKEEMP